MTEQLGRVDGWKAIARHMGRDRSTVIRWASERGMPVHSMPGGKTRTVYALKTELDAWMSGAQLDGPVAPPIEIPVATPIAAPTATVPEPIATPMPPIAATPSRRRLSLVASGLAAVVALTGTYAVLDRQAESAPISGTLDQGSEDQLLRARDMIASRSNDQLDEAIASLRTISGKAPANADVHESLAEAYLLAREFGSLPDAMALANARHEAGAALHLRARSATALRVQGVIAYWWDRDPATAGTVFRQAIAIAPRDALAHLWYANVLADNGEHQAAAREFNAARRLNPGAGYVLADYAWGLWMAGQSREAEAVLSNLVDSRPALASAHDCLSVMAFARGDLAGYASHLRQRADARGAPELAAYSKVVDDAVARGAPQALYSAMFSRALSQVEAASRSDHSWPAFVASMFGDRAQVIEMLRLSRDHGEHWGAAGYTQRIATRWAGDAEIVAALKALATPRIEDAATELPTV